MALNYDPQAQQGIMGAIKGSFSLFGDTNKGGSPVDELQNPQPIDPYESSLSETEIIALTSQWKQDYNVYYDPIAKSQELAFNYWIGKQRNTDPMTVMSNTQNGADLNTTDNLIFESVETFLPIATRANPEPLVQAGNSKEEQDLADDIKVALASEADKQQLRRKLAKMTRSWLLNRIGALKVSWNPHTKRIETTVVNTKKMMFDKKGYVDERGYFIGEWLNEKKSATAKTLTEMFPKKAEAIKLKAGGKMGTSLDYIEWWYKGTDLFFTLDSTVLGKFKNPNWNYDGTEKTIDPDTGEEVESQVKGLNHLDAPTDPYRFLAIFNVNEQPHDSTSLILQNIPQQDMINRREQQIERNVQGMNNGIIVSGEAFTEDQAAQAASALRRGNAIRVPNGDVGKAVLFPQRPALPADVFTSLTDARNELRNIFGTAGSSAQGIKSQETVRGKIMVKDMDSSRIGGGITEYIEQVADSIYNLWVQFMYVFYDDEHFVASAGSVKGAELIKLVNSDFHLLTTLSITVKEGTLIPKDPLTQRNEAIDLWSANAIDPRSLYQKLDFPDPDAATNQLILWQMLQKGQIQPQDYLPTFSIQSSGEGQPNAPAGPLPTEQPGTGGPPVSPVAGAEIQAGPLQPNAQQQSQQLIQSVPLPQQ